MSGEYLRKYSRAKLQRKNFRLCKIIPQNQAIIRTSRRSIFNLLLILLRPLRCNRCHAKRPILKIACPSLGSQTSASIVEYPQAHGHQSTHCCNYKVHPHVGRHKVLSFPRCPVEEGHGKYCLLECQNKFREMKDSPKLQWTQKIRDVYGNECSWQENHREYRDGTHLLRIGLGGYGDLKIRI